MKRSIKLDQELIQSAEVTGKRNKRSIAAQVEYWAGLGKSLETNNSVSVNRLERLTEFNDHFIRAVEEGRQSGADKAWFMRTGFVFEKSKMGSGYVDKVFTDGRRVTGKVVNGEFVEIKSSKPLKSPK